MNFDLIIFDCDGVLVDSEVISCRAHADVLSRHGYPITAEQVLERFLGVSDREARLNVEAELGRSLPDDFETQMKQAALQRYANELQAIPYVADVIAAITLPKCVASSGTPEKIRHGLPLRIQAEPAATLPSRTHSVISDEIPLCHGMFHM